MRTLTICFFLSMCYTTFAQKQANIWYFGDHAGLDFNGGAPVAITGGQTHLCCGINLHNEGSSVISDSAGNLLFYSNGEKIWNANHQIMPHGDSIKGNLSSTQSSLILPLPGSDHIFYLFTTDAYLNNLQNGLRFTVVDMCLDNGLGDVVLPMKNFLLLDTASEKLTAVKHSNGIDYWLIAHKFYSDAFYAYLLTSNGITDTVISKTGAWHIVCPNNSTQNAIGQMKASPNGRRLALVSGQGNMPDCKIIQLFDFDNTSGIISNPVDLGAASSAGMYYGLSFSPNSSKLYISSLMNVSRVFQWDLEAGEGNPDSIYASVLTVVNTNYNTFYGMQLAPDGKIYIARQDKNYLGVIENPNLKAPLCNYVDLGVSLGTNKCSWSLPSFLDNFMYHNKMVSCAGAVRENTSPELAISPTVVSSEIHFKLPSTGTAICQIFDISGRMVLEQHCAGGDVSISAEKLQPGLYLLRATQNGKSYQGKFVKQQN